MSDIYREPKGDFAMKALMHDGKYFRSLRTVNLTLQHHASTITSDDDRYFFFHESDLNVWVHMRQAARTVPIAGTAWGRALLASCLHMLAADIPGNPKKISDNL